MRGEAVRAACSDDKMKPSNHTCLLAGQIACDGGYLTRIIMAGKWLHIDMRNRIAIADGPGA